MGTVFEGVSLYALIDYQKIVECVFRGIAPLCLIPFLFNLWNYRPGHRFTVEPQSPTIVKSLYFISFLLNSKRINFYFSFLCFFIAACYTIGFIFYGIGEVFDVGADKEYYSFVISLACFCVAFLIFDIGSFSYTQLNGKFTWFASVVTCLFYAVAQHLIVYKRIGDDLLLSSLTWACTILQGVLIIVLFNTPLDKDYCLFVILLLFNTLFYSLYYILFSNYH